MTAGRQEACARNNALWCDAVLKSAGARTQFLAGFWQAEGIILPLYPNIVTLSAKPGAGFYEALEALPENTAVKDSFGNLDLEPAGFRKLFSGTWLFRPERATRKPPASSNWHKVAHPEGLKRWLAAWNANEKLHGIFPPKLLDKKTIDFAAIVRDGTIRAGAVFNTGPKLGNKDVLGLSNVFCRRSWLYSALHDLLEPFPHKPVCTYETDNALLSVYRQTGFVDCGNLSIWKKT